MEAFGKATEVGSEVASGATGRWSVSVVAWAGSETVRVLASGDEASAGAVTAAGRASVGLGGTDGGVNFAAAVGLEPCALVAVALVSAEWPGSRHPCSETRWIQEGC